MERLLADIMRGQTVPYSVFFEPRSAFVQWLVEHIKRGERVAVDCGAGVGMLGKILLDKGAPTLSIDFLERDSTESPVLIMDATFFEYHDNMTAVVARPSSGDWIRDTFIKALDGDAKVLYVGVERNYDRDLYDLEDEGMKYQLAFSNAGEEGEEAFWISKI